MSESVVSSLAHRIAFQNAVTEQLGSLDREERHELRAWYENGATVEEFVAFVRSIRTPRLRVV